MIKFKNILKEVFKKTKEEAEKIKMSPDALAKLSAPPSDPSSWASKPVPAMVKPKDTNKDTNKDYTPPELKLGVFEEEEKETDVDAFFYGPKKIDPDRPPETKPKPLFGLKKKKEDDNKKHDPFKIGPLNEVLSEAEISKEDKENVAFMTGLKMAVQDKSNQRKRNLKGYPPDFIRGYKTINQPGLWDKWNAKLTDWAARFGHSYGRRF
jgi:hypothetical protein